MNQKQRIQAELNRRATLDKIIALVLKQDFIVEGEKYTRRGVVQKAVAHKLGVKQTNRLAKAVIEYLATEGVESVTIHGRNYFKNLLEKNFAVQNDDLEGLNV